jgi:lysophospholipase L1-like esterase
MFSRRIAFVLLAALALSAQTSAAVGEPWLAQGQELLFIGDSITHGASDPALKKSDTFHGLLQLYLATHHPTRKLWTANAGRAGDNLTQLMKERMTEKDVFHRISGLLEQPQVAFLLYGMNDAGSLTYLNPQKPPTAQQEFKRSDVFRTQLRAAAGVLKDKGLHVVILSPTAYDETVSKKVKPAVTFNTVLGKYATIASEVASEYDALFIDVHTLMSAKTLEKQKANPNFSYTTDRVHPFAGGTVLAFYSILKAFGLEGPVFEMKLTAAENSLTVESAQQSQLSELSHTAGVLRWTAQETRLPLPIDTQTYPYDTAFADVPFAEEFNQQRLQVQGLAKGSYALSVDGQPVAKFTGDEMAKGIDLSGQAKMPQYQIAWKLRERLYRKQQIEIILRDLNSLRLNMENHFKEDGLVSAALADQDWTAPDAALLLGYLQQQLSTAKKVGGKGGFFGHIARQAQTYLPQVPDLIQELKAIKAEVMSLPASRTHRYELSPTP